MNVLDRLPIPEKRTAVRFGDRNLTVLRDQILVWVSVYLSGVIEPERNTPTIPVLVDTGSNFEFALRERHLREWAGIDPRLMSVVGDVAINGEAVTRREGTVWLHRNMPGRLEVARNEPLFRLEMAKGIAIYADDRVSAGPRLPLLGLPAFLNNDLDLWFDPERRHVTARSGDWRRSLIRLLSRL